MNKSIITVEHLSKSYILKHQNRERYIALRDVIANKAKGLFRPKTLPSPNNETFLALNDISFEINEGDRVGIIGRNGAGKSTLLKVLSRIVAPTKGRITIEGRVASLLEVGTGFHPELTGRENIFLNGSILGMSKEEIRQKFDEIVAFSEVERFLDTPVKRYSSGMYVRLAFSVAAHLDPEILIVDEVLAVGDAAFQKKCLGKMDDVSKTGRTILFVSHNMQMIQKLCNRGILLNKGSLLKAGNIDSIVKTYLEGAQNNQSVFEIAPPTDVSIPGYIISVQIEDLAGTLINEIPIGKAFQIKVKFKLIKKLNHFIIGLGIVTPQDVPLRTTWSAPADVDPGEYTALFENDDLMITSGVYSVAIGLSDNRNTFHYTDNVVKIAISDVIDYKDENRIVNTQSGIIINQMKTTITKI